MGLLEILTLYIAFRIKHFACDFVLQTDWMALTKGKSGAEGYRALFTHAGIHAIGTLIVVLTLAPSYWLLALVDFFIHGAVDRIKATYTVKKGWGVQDKFFWWSFGLDQEAHNFTHLAYIVIIVSGYSVI